MPPKREKTTSYRGSKTEESGEDETSSSQGSPTAIRLSTIAVVLSVIAIVIAFLVPGPAPPGSIMAQHSVGGPATIGSTCTHYVGAEVSISAPGPGTIVVIATVGVGVNHSFGLSDEARIVIATSPTDCTLNNFTAFVSVPYSLPTDPFHFETVPLSRPFNVNGPATVTFYINGVMAHGADASDRFDSASIVAVFYPR